MPTPPAIPLHRKILYSLILLGVTLGLVELGLTVAPHIWARTQWIPPPDGATTWLIFTGDSVTAGYGLADHNLAYPGVIQAELLANHRTSYGVYTAAQSSADVARVSTQIRDGLTVTPMDVHPVVLCMVGHNDLMAWAKGPLQGIEQQTARQGPQNLGSGPRLLRLLSWFGAALNEEVPHANVLAEWEEAFKTTLGKAQKRALAAKGDFIMLTYLVPGEPEGHSRQSLQIQATRRAQLDVNAAIRRTATALGAPLIDVGAASDSGPYDPNIFIDNIHLSVEGHRRVGILVRDQLAMTGVLPVSLFKARPASGG